MRYAFGIEYDGSAFLGWQVQRQEPTVQACVEAALTRVADHPVHVSCCGRTDTGVHALCQVAHFDTTAQRSRDSWILGANSNLPPAISILWLCAVDGNFHARFSAFARSYRYRILNRRVRPALGAKYVGWCRKPLDAEMMHLAAQALRGEHDFSAFRAASCQARHALREVHDIAVTRTGNEIHIEVTANGFLYHMVRNIAGSLISIGQHDQPIDWMEALLHGRDRTLAAPTAAAEGLYFLGARYPEQYQLPSAEINCSSGRDSL